MPMFGIGLRPSRCQYLQAVAGQLCSSSRLGLYMVDQRQVLLILRRPQLNNINCVTAIVGIVQVGAELARASVLPAAAAFAASAATEQQQVLPSLPQRRMKGRKAIATVTACPTAMAVVLIEILKERGDGNAVVPTRQDTSFSSLFR